MNYVPSSTAGLIRLSQRNAAATQRAVEPHLEPGEEPLVLQPVRPMSGRWGALRFPRLGIEPAVVELPEQCVFAVTADRFLVVSYPYPTDEPTELVLARPLGDVRDLQRGRAFGAKELSFTAGGARYVLWVNGHMAKLITEALQPQTG